MMRSSLAALSVSAFFTCVVPVATAQSTASPRAIDTSIHVGAGFGLRSRSHSTSLASVSSTGSGIGNGVGVGMTVDEQLQTLSDSLGLNPQQTSDVRAILENERAAISQIRAADRSADEREAMILDQSSAAGMLVRLRLSPDQRRIYDRMPLNRLGLGRRSKEE